MSCITSHHAWLPYMRFITRILIMPPIQLALVTNLESGVKQAPYRLPPTKPYWVTSLLHHAHLSDALMSRAEVLRRRKADGVGISAELQKVVRCE